MLFTIHPDGAAPIYEQIVAQVIYGVGRRLAGGGGLIPSVRELAQALLVHPNTVARAFQELERAGVVTARRGLGMEVTAGRRACRARPSAATSSDAHPPGASARPPPAA